MSGRKIIEGLEQALTHARGEAESDVEPVVRATLPCRFGCREPAAAIVHYPAACICFADPVQALCRQHVEKGLQNNEGRVVAWLEPGETR